MIECAVSVAGIKSGEMGRWRASAHSVSISKPRRGWAVDLRRRRQCHMLILLVVVFALVAPGSVDSKAAVASSRSSLRHSQGWIDPMHGRPNAPVDGCSANGCCCCINTNPAVVKSNNMGKRPKSNDVPCTAGNGEIGEPAKGWVVTFCREACTSSYDGFLLDGIDEDWINNGGRCAMHCQSRIGLVRCPPGQVVDPDSSTDRCVYER